MVLVGDTIPDHISHHLLELPKDIILAWEHLQKCTWLLTLKNVIEARE